MKKKYSIFALIKNSLSYHENWQRAWRDPEPKSEYDAVIVGGGGHGLATAYYLAKEHNLKNIAVVEKGWIGGGNTGRNTTIITSYDFLGSGLRHIFCQFSWLEREFFKILKMEYFFFTKKINKKK